MAEGLSVEQLLIARLWIGRLGESDVFGWWATDGVLGLDGAFVGPRVLPATHPTGRARIVFAVARHACNERHPDPKAAHLFRLDPEIEDRVDALLVEKLREREWWAEMVGKLEKIQAGASIGDVLREAGVVSDADIKQVSGLPLGPDGRSLPVPRAKSWEESVRLLAAGFIRSQPKALTVPYLANGD